MLILTWLIRINLFSLKSVSKRERHESEMLFDIMINKLRSLFKKASTIFLQLSYNLISFISLSYFLSKNFTKEYSPLKNKALIS